MSLTDRTIADCEGRKVAQADLADIFGVAPKTIWEWQAQGMPYQVRDGVGSEHVFDTAACITWWGRREVAKAAGGETAKDRLARVQADRVELDIAERSGQLVDAREVVKELSAANTATRALLLQIPERLAAALTESQRDMIREELEHALRNLAAYDPRRTDDPFGLGGIPTAGAHDGGAVGRISSLPERPVGDTRPV